MDKTSRRRSHFKSRHGCRECKRRRIKCSETRPVCVYCERFSKECEWVTISSQAVTATKTTSSSPRVLLESGESQTIPSFPSTGCGFDSDLFGVSDMALLHHWSTVTYGTLDVIASPQKRKLNQSTVVKLGFEHLFVLRGILSVAALHLAFLNPAHSNTFLLQASAHQNLAITEFQSILDKMNEQNCIPAFAFSALTTIYGFAFAGLEHNNDSISAMVNTVSLVRGISTILGPYLKSVEQSEFNVLMIYGRDTTATGQIPELTRLQHLVATNSNQDKPATVDALLEAIEALHGAALESIPEIEQGRRNVSILMRWPTSLSSTFSNLLDMQHPFALLVLAHFAKLLSLAGDVWWLQSYHSSLVTTMKPLLDPQYHDLLLASCH